MSLIAGREDDARATGHALTVLENARRELATAGRSVWLAGLGAVAEARDGGRELFGRLVEKGRPFEARRRKAAETLAGKAGQAAKDLGQRLQDTAVHEGRRLLARLPVVRSEDLQALSRRLETLAARLDDVAAAGHPENPTAAEGEGAPAPRQRRTAKR